MNRVAFISFLSNDRFHSLRKLDELIRLAEEKDKEKKKESKREREKETGIRKEKEVAKS